jgi:hypothetical protein
MHNFYLNVKNNHFTEMTYTSVIIIIIIIIIIIYNIHTKLSDSACIGLGLSHVGGSDETRFRIANIKLMNELQMYHRNPVSLTTTKFSSCVSITTFKSLSSTSVLKFV